MKTSGNLGGEESKSFLAPDGETEHRRTTTVEEPPHANNKEKSGHTSTKPLTGKETNQPLEQLRISHEALSQRRKITVRSLTTSDMSSSKQTGDAREHREDEIAVVKSQISGKPTPYLLQWSFR